MKHEIKTFLKGLWLVIAAYIVLVILGIPFSGLVNEPLDDFYSRLLIAPLIALFFLSVIFVVICIIWAIGYFIFE